MHPFFNSSILSRETKGIPSHGMQYIITTHGLIAGNNISYGVISYMSHVNPARRIREHLKAVVFRPDRIFINPECLMFFPVTLPLRLYLFWVIFYGQAFSSYLTMRHRSLSAPPSMGGVRGGLIYVMSIV